MTVQYTSNWSYSTLTQYESCPLRVKLKKIDKLPELPLPPNNPMERGNREHSLYEFYIKGEISSLLASEARSIKEFLPLFEHARDLYADGLAFAEGDWWFDRDWMVCDRDSVWLWAKLDLLVLDYDAKLAVAIDFKTGRSQYKIIDHVGQTQLYAAATVLKYPWVERVDTELWYVDEGHIKTVEYTSEEALKAVGRFDKRAQRIYDDRHFRPNPNISTCRYCPYNRSLGTGACPVSAC